MLEEILIVELMRDLEHKLDTNDLGAVIKTIRKHFVDWIGSVPPHRLFEQRPKKKLRNKNRDRVTIILDNDCICVIWKGIEINKKLKTLQLQG